MLAPDALGGRRGVLAPGVMGGGCDVDAPSFGMPTRTLLALAAGLLLVAGIYLVVGDRPAIPAAGTSMVPTDSAQPHADSSPATTGAGAGETGADSSPAVPGTDAGATRVAGMPDSLFVRRGACPFECCVYRSWVAEVPIAASSTEGSHADTLFTIAPGEAFAALTGNVHILGVERVVVTAPAESFVAGDTLVVLDYVGEGYYNVWHEGQVRQVPQFWSDEDYHPEHAPGHSVGARRTEWWVQARNADGRTGWFEMSDKVSVRGSDACA